MIQHRFDVDVVVKVTQQKLVKKVFIINVHQGLKIWRINGFLIVQFLLRIDVAIIHSSHQLTKNNLSSII